MKRVLESWSVVCVTESASAAVTLAQTSITEVLRWTSATVDQARSWTSVANNAVDAYAARLIAAHTRFALK